MQKAYRKIKNRISDYFFGRTMYALFIMLTSHVNHNITVELYADPDTISFQCNCGVVIWEAELE